MGKCVRLLLTALRPESSTWSCSYESSCSHWSASMSHESPWLSNPLAEVVTISESSFAQLRLTHSRIPYIQQCTLLLQVLRAGVDGKPSITCLSSLCFRFWKPETNRSNISLTDDITYLRESTNCLASSCAIYIWLLRLNILFANIWSLQSLWPHRAPHRSQTLCDL